MKCLRGGVFLQAVSDAGNEVLHVRLIVFTKSFDDAPVDRLADAVAGTGADGADLVVRDGQTVTPAQPQRIGDVAKALQANGLELGMVSTDLLVGDDLADRVIGAAADAGVRYVRPGFYKYDPHRGYRRTVDDTRRDLAGLAKVAARHGVTLALQLHHKTVHTSAALALELLRDLDDVRLYIDPGNQVKEGSEDWRMHLDLVLDRVVCIGVKNAGWYERDGTWVPEWQPLVSGGIAPWPEIMPGLRERGYDRLFSLHAHYFDDDIVGAIRRDIDLARSLFAGP